MSKGQTIVIVDKREGCLGKLIKWFVYIWAFIIAGVGFWYYFCR